MSYHQWVTLDEIQRQIQKQSGRYYSIASISARVRDLRKEKFGGHIVERRRRGDPKLGLFEYRLLA